MLPTKEDVSFYIGERDGFLKILMYPSSYSVGLNLEREDVIVMMYNDVEDRTEQVPSPLAKTRQ